MARSEDAIELVRHLLRQRGANLTSRADYLAEKLHREQLYNMPHRWFAKVECDELEDEWCTTVNLFDEVQATLEWLDGIEVFEQAIHDGWV